MHGLPTLVGQSPVITRSSGTIRIAAATIATAKTNSRIASANFMRPAPAQGQPLAPPYHSRRSDAGNRDTTGTQHGRSITLPERCRHAGALRPGDKRSADKISVPSIGNAGEYIAMFNRITLSAVSAAVLLSFVCVGNASAAGGCGPGFHRGPYGGCRINGGAVVVRPPVGVPAPVVCTAGLRWHPRLRRCVVR